MNFVSSSLPAPSSPLSYLPLPPNWWCSMFYLLESSFPYFLFFGHFPVLIRKLFDLNTFRVGCCSICFFPIYTGGRNEEERGSGPAPSCLLLFCRMQTICVSLQNLVYSHPGADSDTSLLIFPPSPRNNFPVLLQKLLSPSLNLSSWSFLS